MRAETPPRRGRRDLLQGLAVWMLFLALVPSASAQPVIEVTEVPTASVAPTLAGLDPASAAGAAFAAGWEGYTDLRLTDAIAYWQEAVAQADDPQASRDLRAWLAEAARRVAQQPEELREVGELVLRQQLCAGRRDALLVDDLRSTGIEPHPIVEIPGSVAFGFARLQSGCPLRVHRYMNS